MLIASFKGAGIYCRSGARGGPEPVIYLQILLMHLLDLISLRASVVYRGLGITQLLPCGARVRSSIVRISDVQSLTNTNLIQVAI